MTKEFLVPAVFTQGARVGSTSSYAVMTAGTGSPESSITAPIGSVYFRLDGSSSTSMYVKESGAGNTGWIAYGAPGSVSFAIAAVLAAATTDVLTAKVTGDSDQRFVLNTDGKMEWGGGTLATDTFFYRESAGRLKTDGVLYVASTITCAFIERQNFAHPYIDISSENSVVIINRTDPPNIVFVVRGMAAQSGDLQQWQTSASVILTAIDSTGKLVFGASGSQDTNVYRGAANTLKTDDSLVVTGTINQFTVSDTLFKLERLTLASTERMTLSSTGTLVLNDLDEPAPLVLGTPKNPAVSFVVPNDYFLDVLQRLTLAVRTRATLEGSADLFLTDDFSSRSRLVLSGRG